MKIGLFLVMMVIAFGCTRRPPAEMGSPAQRAASGQVGKSELSETKSSANERIILKSADISLKVEAPEASAEKISQIAVKYGGYTFTSGNTFMQIRISAGHFDSAIAEIESLGETSRKNVHGKDVSDEYYDAKIRLENKEKARSRYLELLAKAENVEATLKVEKELERVIGEIESLKGSMARIEQEQKLSLISIAFEKRGKLGPVGFVFYWTFRGIGWLFVRE